MKKWTEAPSGDPVEKMLTWGGLVTVTLVVSILYPFMEWLFISTMPSFMSSSSFGETLVPLLFSASLFSAGSLIFLLAAWQISLLPLGKAWKTLVIRLSCLEPAILLTMTSLLLVDNFTYTNFKYGVVSTSGLIRGLYGAAFIVAAWFFYRQIIGRILAVLKTTLPITAKRVISIAVGLFLILSLVIPLIEKSTAQAAMLDGTSSGMKKKPNILYITSDGMLASHFSIYGYNRETTPNLDKISSSALVAENHFSNAGTTSGSLVSILTSKYPAETRVLYPPNILRGNDTFQHFPGILRSYGYYNVMISHPYYADPYILNFDNSFDEANGRFEYKSPILKKINEFIPTNEAYFLYQMGNRISDRVRHIFS